MNNFIQKTVFTVSKNLRRIVSKIYDPLIKIRVGDSNILIPLSHELPNILELFPSYSLNLGRLAKYTNEKYNTLTLIDVGSNVGDSVAILRQYSFFPILCIEGNNKFYPILQRNSEIFKEIFIENVYLGDETKSIHKEIKQGHGSAHLIESLSTTKIIKLEEVLLRNPIFLNSKMIKIDTDGFDTLILKGAVDFLKRAKPIIFFEYDPFFLEKQGEDNIEIFKILKEIGYRYLMIYDNFGEYIISLDLIKDTEKIEEIKCYFSGNYGEKYCDISIFHIEDKDLFKYSRESEIKHFKNLKQNKKTTQ